MAINIEVRIDLTPKQKKVIRAAVVSGSVIGALGVGIALAAPHQWKANDPLAAADLNGLNVITYTTDGGATSSYSVGATKFCGATPVPTAGDIVYSGTHGYRAAKKQCESVTSCGNSATAHMCTAEEMVRSSQLGIPTAYGWIASGVAINGTTLDCVGWSNGTVGQAGAAWDNNFGAGGTPNILSCNATTSILCCD